MQTALTLSFTILPGTQDQKKKIDIRKKKAQKTKPHQPSFLNTLMVAEVYSVFLVHVYLFILIREVYK